MRPAAVLVAAAPLAAALAALIAVYVTGFDQSVDMPAELESRFYGFFLDRYPLYAFVIVYAVARLLAAAFAPGPASALRRAGGSLAGIALVLALSLHPTFGGLVLRGGFGTGGVAFLNHAPLLVAYVLGTAVAALVLGSAMGAFVLVANPGPREASGWARRLLHGAVSALAAYLLLWYAFAVLGFARTAGFGRWPHRPLDTGDMLLAAAALVLAFLPHALLVAARIDAAPRPAA